MIDSTQLCLASQSHLQLSSVLRQDSSRSRWVHLTFTLFWFFANTFPLQNGMNDIFMLGSIEKNCFIWTVSWVLGIPSAETKQTYRSNHQVFTTWDSWDGLVKLSNRLARWPKKFSAETPFHSYSGSGRSFNTFIYPSIDSPQLIGSEYGS